MGEVFRARDPRMGRDVAIKISAERFSDRFEREVHAVAALNHPNICHIYDVGPNYLVMELVEGTTLADRVRLGAIPLDEALPVACQIAGALEAAHEKGIIHRDLKPANIKLKPDGTVKVLDFGLAKIAQPSAATGNPDVSTTLTIEATRVGQILGTAAYMAPEQASGKMVDRRADIWSFGVVLWEMLTGRRLFPPGETVSHVLADVLRRDIDFTRLPSAMPMPVRELLKRCLDRDLATRLRDIGEARIAIQKYLADPTPPSAPSQASARRGLLAWALAGILALAVFVLSTMLWRTRQPADRPLVRLDVDLGPGVSLSSFAGPNVILSPDGTRLVYVSHNRLFTRRLDQQQATELPGAEGGTAPFFSPDGQWVAFFAEGKLKKVPVVGGAATVLCNAPNGMGGSWGEDGVIASALQVTGGLSRIAANGGAPSPLSQPDSALGETTHRWPQILPGGKAVLFTAHSQQVSGFDEAVIQVMSVGDGRKKTLVRGGTYGRFLTSGHLLYVNRGTLFAVPFDLSSLEIRGAPVPLQTEVAHDFNGGARFDSQAGTLVYETGAAQGRSLKVAWLEKDGKTRALLPKPGDYGRPSFSPDGYRLALDLADGARSDIWIYDLRRDAMARLTWDGQVNQFPIWSPDGLYIVFADQDGLSWTRADGAGRPQRLLRIKSSTMPWSFASDGKRLAYFELDPVTAFHIWTLPLVSDTRGLRAGQPELFLQTSADERHPAFSPDGRWLAYSSTESGDFQVYVRPFPDKGGKWQISTSGGVYPAWSRTGRQLFFESLDSRIMVADYAVEGDSFIRDMPRVWSETRLANLGLFKNFDLAPDGKRVVALLPAEGGEVQLSRHHVVFLQNFLDELRRRAPIKK